MPSGPRGEEWYTPIGDSLNRESSSGEWTQVLGGENNDPAHANKRSSASPPRDAAADEHSALLDRFRLH